MKIPLNQRKQSKKSFEKNFRTSLINIFILSRIFAKFPLSIYLIGRHFYKKRLSTLIWRSEIWKISTRVKWCSDGCLSIVIYYMYLREKIQDIHISAWGSNCSFHPERHSRASERGKSRRYRLSRFFICNLIADEEMTEAYILYKWRSNILAN